MLYSMTFSKLKIVACCNGVICLHDSDDDNVVPWNPATRETKLTPYSLLEDFHDNLPDGDLYFEAVRFGFDADNNDYKLFMIYSLHCNFHLWF